MRGKKGFELSFSVIFSIIVIAAILAVAFYTIGYFLKLKNCTELGLYARDFQSKIDDAWNADSVNDLFTGFVPSGVDEVCVGDLEEAGIGTRDSALKRFQGTGANLFYYPVPSSCDLRYGKLEHVQFPSFTCVEVIEGKAGFKIVKGSYDNLVFVCAGNATSCGTSVTGPNLGQNQNSNNQNSNSNNQNNPQNLNSNVQVTEAQCSKTHNDGTCGGLWALGDDSNNNQAYKEQCCGYGQGWCC